MLVFPYLWMVDLIMEKFTTTLTPRFNDTDALGHINNATFATWLETGRRPIFKIFNPSLNMEEWNLIVAKVDIDFLKQTNYQDDVTVETTFSKLGNSSMTLKQKVLQNGEVMAEGKVVMIHFDYKSEKSVRIPDSIRSELEKYLEK